MSYARKIKSFISTVTLGVLLLSQSLASVTLPVFDSLSPMLQEIAATIEEPLPVVSAQSGGQWVRATASHITACNAIGEQRAVSPEGLGCVSGENLPR